MTPEQLTDTLDRLQQAAGEDVDRLPGLIEVNSDVWCQSLYAIERITKTLDEGIRHRDITGRALSRPCGQKLVSAARLPWSVRQDSLWC